MNAGGMEYGKRTNWPEGSRLGSADNVYIEDNRFDFSTQNNGGLGWLMQIQERPMCFVIIT